LSEYPPQKNAKTPLSQIYNDTSVLENMHCLLITTLLRKHGFTFLFGPASSATLNRPSQGPALDWTGFRKILFSTILATDMAMHFGWIVKLGELGDKIAEDRCSMDEAEVWEDRIMICQALMKCSDISNPVRADRVSLDANRHRTDRGVTSPTTADPTARCLGALVDGAARGVDAASLPRVGPQAARLRRQERRRGPAGQGPGRLHRPLRPAAFQCRLGSHPS
jgi:hypothetical protein